MSDRQTLTGRMLSMAGLDFTAGEAERAIFRQWLEALPEEQRQAFYHDVSSFGKLLGLSPGEAEEEPDDPIQKARHDGAYYYIMAMWKLYQLIDMGAVQRPAPKEEGEGE